MALTIGATYENGILKLPNGVPLLNEGDRVWPRLGWPLTGITGRLQKHPTEVQKLTRFRQAIDDIPSGNRSSPR